MIVSFEVLNAFAQEGPGGLGLDVCIDDVRTMIELGILTYVDDEIGTLPGMSTRGAVAAYRVILRVRGPSQSRWYRAHPEHRPSDEVTVSYNPPVPRSGAYIL